MGKKSRDKGITFERYAARRVLPCHTLYPHWRRTKAGERQHHGDVIPTTRDGEIISLDCYVECKRKAHVSERDVRGWIKEVKAESAGKDWILVYKQDYGPIYIMGHVLVNYIRTEEPAYLARRTER